jgi:hypothetical protein
MRRVGPETDLPSFFRWTEKEFCTCGFGARARKLLSGKGLGFLLDKGVPHRRAKWSDLRGGRRENVGFCCVAARPDERNEPNLCSLILVLSALVRWGSSLRCSYPARSGSAIWPTAAAAVRELITDSDVLSYQRACERLGPEQDMHGASPFAHSFRY